jgi:purine nucleosidase
VPGSDRTVEPQLRVICDNDYCGDPDGLVQLAHHLLSPSVDLRLIIGSPPATYDPAWRPRSADLSVSAAARITELAGRGDVPIAPGAQSSLKGRTTPQPSPGADAIVAEAMRDDTKPLFIACGGGLTSVASAWLTEPRIADRLTLVWIGGREHPDLAPPAPGQLEVEYNTSIDLIAAQVVFNDSDLRIWQVPRSTYRQVLVSRSEMLTRMRPHGPLGEHLFDAIGQIVQSFATFGLQMGETYVLGDSPLVLLTALWSPFDPTPSSSEWVDRPRPDINDAGLYQPRHDASLMRIFTRVDTRLLLEDLYAKLQLQASRYDAEPDP